MCTLAEWLIRESPKRPMYPRHVTYILSVMKILIADDQDRVRHALKILLTQQPGLQVVSEASDGEGLLVQANATQADLVLMDWELPGLAEAGGLPVLHKLCPTLQIVVLSSRPGVRLAAKAAGADAYVSKSDPPERLLAIVQRCGERTETGDSHVTTE